MQASGKWVDPCRERAPGHVVDGEPLRFGLWVQSSSARKEGHPLDVNVRIRLVLDEGLEAAIAEAHPDGKYI